MNMKVKNHEQHVEELIRATKLPEHAAKVGAYTPAVFASEAPKGEDSLAECLKSLLKNIVAYDAQDKQWYLWDGQLHRPIETGEATNILIRYSFEYLRRIIDSFSENKGEVMEEARQASDITNQLKASLKAEKDKAQKAIIQAEIDELSGSNSGLIEEGKEAQSALAGPTTRLMYLENNRDQLSVVTLLQRKLPFNTERRDADDRRYLVFENGVLDMEAMTGVRPDGSIPVPQLLEHSPERLVWRSIPHNWNPQARAPHWEHLISSDSFYDTADAQTFGMLLSIGLSGQINRFPKHMVSLYGETNSGKGVISELLKRIYPDHVTLTNQTVATKMRDGTEQSRKRKAIQHSRIVVASECVADLDENFLLDYAGNGGYEVRSMGVNPVIVQPQGIMVMTSNEPVRLDAGKPQLKDRLYPIKMPYSRIAETHPDQWSRDDDRYGPYEMQENGTICKPMDTSLPDKLDEEAEGISAWMVRHFQRALSVPGHKLQKSEPMEARLREQAADSDMVGIYLDYANLIYSPGIPNTKAVRVAELHMEYINLCRTYRKPPLTIQAFGRKLNGYQWGEGVKLSTVRAANSSRLAEFRLVTE